MGFFNALAATSSCLSLTSGCPMLQPGMEGSEGEVQDKAGSYHDQGLIVQQIAVANFNLYSPDEN